MNLRLLQISDSALPIGGYTHSWGLEAAIARRLVEDAESLERFVRNWLWHALGPLEGVVVSASCRAASSADWQTVARANAILTASIAPPSHSRGQPRDGRATAGAGIDLGLECRGSCRFQTACHVRAAISAHWNHAVVFGLLGSIAGGSVVETLQAYLHQAVAGMIARGRPGNPGRAHAWPADDRVSS